MSRLYLRNVAVHLLEWDVDLLACRPRARGPEEEARMEEVDGEHGQRDHAAVEPV